MLIGSLNGFEAVQDFCVIPRHDKPENLPVLYTDSESQYEVQQTVNVLRKGDEKSIVKQLLHLLQWCFPYNALILDGSVTYAHEEGSWRLSKCLGGMMEVSDSDMWKPTVLRFQMMSVPPLPWWKQFCKGQGNTATRLNVSNATLFVHLIWQLLTKLYATITRMLSYRCSACVGHRYDALATDSALHGCVVYSHICALPQPGQMHEAVADKWSCC